MLMKHRTKQGMTHSAQNTQGALGLLDSITTKYIHVSKTLTEAAALWVPQKHHRARYPIPEDIKAK